MKNKVNILRIPFYEFENIEKLIDDSITKINNQERSLKKYYNLLNVYKINYVPLIVKKRIKLKKILFENKRKPHFLSDLDKKRYQQEN
ncbi:hypothetical protein [Chryseobacterium gambrini]|uniref:hypothetical protein n=1 Tax=Chryseobacterium gambrini TaxID=373672 RepID=UPI003BA671FB